MKTVVPDRIEVKAACTFRDSVINLLPYRGSERILQELADLFVEMQRYMKRQPEKKP